MFLPLPAHAAEWRATERTAHYAVSGATGIALYESIGANGPQLSNGSRTIALTEWKLTWSRDYKPNGAACTLAAAKPNLAITYRLPKPREKLEGAVARNWRTFIDGMAAHEKIHGDLLRKMTDEVISETVGLTLENDAKCMKIRAEVKARALAAHDRYKEASRDFDRREMSEGGNVQRLILGLVNKR